MFAEEYITLRTLESFGFEKADPQSILPYDPVVAKLVFEFGKVSKTRVLVSPPICSSFYYPKKIIIEMKSCKEAFGVSFAKSVLFAEKERGSFSSLCCGVSSAYEKPQTPLQKMQTQYEVAFATLNKFSSSLIAFACANQIPFLSFYENTIYAGMKSCIEELKKEFLQNPVVKNLIEDFLCFKLSFEKVKELLLVKGLHRELAVFESFIKRAEFYISNASFDQLQKGKVLFLIWI